MCPETFIIYITVILLVSSLRHVSQWMSVLTVTAETTLERYTFSCHLLHVSAVFGHRQVGCVRSDNKYVQYSTGTVDCTGFKYFSGRCIWGWFCSLTPSVKHSYRALPFYLFFLHPSSFSWTELGSIVPADGVGYGSDHRWRCTWRPKNKTLIFYTRHPAVL